jgi:hypothetical protein
VLNFVYRPFLGPANAALLSLSRRRFTRKRPHDSFGL